jgi:hypothetical protein
MTAGITPPPATGSASFELERFEWTAPDRLELAGRWFGVRGLRFMRPTLDLHGSGDRRRLLALLEHKPWAADDGQEWVAAFPWEGSSEEFTEAELAVAPSVTVELVLAGSSAKPPGRSRKAKPRARRRDTASADGQSAGPARTGVTAVRVTRSRGRPGAETDRLRKERDAAVRQRDAAREEREAAVRERDAAREERDAAVRERDAALSERDDLAAARSAALSQLESVMTERDVAMASHAAAVRARQLATEERNAATAARDAALRERQAARAERDARKRQRDAASQKRDEALRERDALQARLDEAVGELTAARRRGVVPQPDLIDRAPALGSDAGGIPQRRIAPSLGVPATRTRWTARLLALAALAVIVVILVMVISGRI